MNWLRPVLAIAAFEARLSLRMIRAWILGLIAVLLAGGFMTQYAVMHRFFSGFSGAYSFMTRDMHVILSGFWIGIPLSLFGVFYAFDWRHRDRSTAFAPTFDAAPISSLQHVWGKFLGLSSIIVAPVLLLLLIQIIVGLSMGIAAAPSTYFTMDIETGLLLPLVPMAIAFGLAGLTGRRDVAIVGALAWFGAGFGVGFKLDEQWAMLVGGAQELPLHSDFIGAHRDLVSHLQTVQRVALIGFFVSLASWGPLGLPRNAGASRNRLLATLSAVAAVVLVTLGIWGAYAAARNERLAIVDAEKAVADAGVALVVHREIEVTLSGRHMEGVATLKVRNPHERALDVLHFRLNAGLAVSAVEAGGVAVPHERTKTVLTVKQPLAPGAEESFTFRYAGSIGAASVDAPVALSIAEIEATLRVNRRILGTMPAILESGAAALGIDAGWYPESGVQFGHAYPEVPPASFATGVLTVHVPAGWKAASVGRRETVDERTFRFTTDVAVPGLSLNAAPYAEIETTIAGVLTRVMYLPKHERNVSFFREAGERLSAKATERFEDVRTRTGLTYPYPELDLVEVPQQLAAYGAGWNAPNRMGAPGVVMLRECGVFGARFENPFKRAKARFDERSGKGGSKVRINVNGQEMERAPDEAEEGEDLTTFDPVRAKADLLSSFCSTDWLGGDVERLALRSFFEHRAQGSGRASPLLAYALPNYLAELSLGRATFDSPEAIRTLNGPVMGQVIQAQLQGRDKDIPEILVTGIADMDHVYELISSRPLDGMDPQDIGRDFLGVMHLRGRQPLRALNDTMGEEAFRGAMGDLLAAKQGSSFTWDDFRAAILGRTEESKRHDIEVLLDNWVAGTTLPGFVVSDVRTQRLPGETESWQVLARVRNLGTGDGTAELSVGKGKERRKLLVSVPAQGVVEAGLVSPTKSEGWALTPYLALNRTSPAGSVKLLEGTAIDAGFEGTREPPPSERKEPVIVDNLDAGFTVVLEGGKEAGFLAQGDDKKPLLAQVFPWQERSKWGRWRPSASMAWYRPWGMFDATAALRQVSKSDAGAPLAWWRTELPAKGRWRVEAYLPPHDDQPMSRRTVTKVEFIVHHGDGDATVALDVDGKDGHWADLGRFHFDGKAEVELRAVEEGLLVADAIRFTQEDQ